MSLIQIEWNPTSRQLRQFGSLCAIALPALGWWLSRPESLLPRLLDLQPAEGSWRAATMAALACVGLAIAIASWTVPRIVRPVFVGLCLVAAPIGLVVSEFVIGLAYFLVITPIGLVLRSTGRDSLGLRLDRQSKTYWSPVPNERRATDYYRQF
jgi:hypothetical protein